MGGWQVRTARWVMAVQAVASIGIWVVQRLTVLERLDHGQAVPGSGWLVLGLNPVLAVLVAVAAAFLARHAWAAALGVAMEVNGAVSALISVLTGHYQAVVAIVLAVAVSTLIVRRRQPAVA